MTDFKQVTKESPHLIFERILILEDDLFSAELLADMLSDLGVADIIIETDGNKALTYVEKQPVDIIFCDINMPCMDGVEFIRHLATQNYKGSISLVSGVNYDFLKIIENMAKSYGINVIGSFNKPIFPDKLEALLKQSISLTQNTPPTFKKITANKLREGLDLNQLVLYFQPKVSVYGWQVSSVECLARWLDPVKGLLPPYAFIDVAEQSGLIDQLTLILIEKAATYLAEWRQKGASFKLAINVSMLSLQQVDLPDIYENIVRSNGVEPSDFIIEVTESALMKDQAITLDVLSRLRIKGFTLSIDDFGTGYSSMEQLLSLPFTELKLDRAFVHNAHENKKASAILESNVNLGRSLKLQLVAEGVENRQDWGLIASLGCQEMQGYLISKPMPDEELFSWVEEWENQRTDVSTITSGSKENHKTDGIKVLVVEDNEYVRGMYDAALGSKYQLIYTESGEECLQTLQNITPDLIMLDVELPGIDGYETCAQIKQADHTATIPVMFVSGHDLIENKIKGYEVGGEDYISKPFNPYELESKVSHFIETVTAKNQLKSQANYASNTAMTAMTNLGELGTLLETIKNLNHCHDYQELATTLLAGVQLYGLNAVVQIRSSKQALTINSQGITSPLEVSVIDVLANMDRITQFNNRICITYDHVSLLVKNLPKDNDEYCGRLRDHLAMLVEAAEASFHVISSKIELARCSEAIERAISIISDTLSGIDDAQRKSSISAYTAATDFQDNMDKALLNISLTNTEDEFLTTIIHDGIERILLSQTAKYDDQDKMTLLIDELIALVKTNKESDN